MTVYGYVRVSTLRQASEGDSLASQQSQLQGYAQMKNLMISNIVVEDGVSGAIPLHERPKGGPLFDLLQAGDVVIAAKLDRLFRSALDALTVTDDLKKRGVGVHLLDLGGDIAGNGLSKLFLTIAAAFAEAERDRIRERIGQAKRWQREKGEFLGGTKPPLGFRRVEGSKLLEVDEEGQRALLYIKRARKSGLSLEKITKVLNKRGISVSKRTVEMRARELAR